MSIITAADGTKIYGQFVNKKSTKTPIVFIHGFVLNWTCFEKEIAFFKKRGHPIVYFDLRGHGKSGRPRSAEAYSFPTFVDDIKRVLQRFSLKKKVILVGYSLGGMIALHYAAQYPNRVSKLIIIDSADKAPEKNKLAHLAEKSKFFRTAYSFLAQEHPKRSRKERDVSIEEIHMNPKLFFTEQVFRTDPEILLHLVDTIFSKESKITTITVPTLLIGSKDDEFFSAKQELALAKKIPRTIIKVLPGKHDIIMRQPHLISTEIKQFLHTNASYFKD